MVVLLSWADAVDIGLGRGRLASEAAASLARVDVAMRSAFGRAADINEAWRSPEQANANYARYIAFINGRGSWAPIALRAEESIHCRGYAVDTDDTSDAQMRIWNDHGWYWTVYRNGKLAERWHLEYFANRDNHRNAPAGSIDERLIVNKQDEEWLNGMGQSIKTDVINAVRADIATVHESVLTGQAAILAEAGKIRADLNYIHVASPVSLKAIYEAARRGEVSLSDVQVKAIGDRLNDSLVSGLDAALRDDFDGVIKRLNALPKDTVAALKSAL